MSLIINSLLILFLVILFTFLIFMFLKNILKLSKDSIDLVVKILTDSVKTSKKIVESSFDNSKGCMNNISENAKKVITDTTNSEKEFANKSLEIMDNCKNEIIETMNNISDLTNDVSKNVTENNKKITEKITDLANKTIKIINKIIEKLPNIIRFIAGAKILKRVAHPIGKLIGAVIELINFFKSEFLIFLKNAILKFIDDYPIKITSLVDTFEMKYISDAITNALKDFILNKEFFTGAITKGLKDFILDKEFFTDAITKGLKDFILDKEFFTNAISKALEDFILNKEFVGDAITEGLKDLLKVDLTSFVPILDIDFKNTIIDLGSSVIDFNKYIDEDSVLFKETSKIDKHLIKIDKHMESIVNVISGAVSLPMDIFGAENGSDIFTISYDNKTVLISYNILLEIRDNIEKLFRNVNYMMRYMSNNFENIEYNLQKVYDYSTNLDIHNKDDLLNVIYFYLKTIEENKDSINVIKEFITGENVEIRDEDGEIIYVDNINLCLHKIKNIIYNYLNNNIYDDDYQGLPTIKDIITIHKFNDNLLRPEDNIINITGMDHSINIFINDFINTVMDTIILLENKMIILKDKLFTVVTNYQSEDMIPGDYKELFLGAKYDSSGVIVPLYIGEELNPEYDDPEHNQYFQIQSGVDAVHYTKLNIDDDEVNLIKNSVEEFLSDDQQNIGLINKISSTKQKTKIYGPEPTSEVFQVEQFDYKIKGNSDLIPDSHIHNRHYYISYNKIENLNNYKLHLIKFQYKISYETLINPIIYKKVSGNYIIYSIGKLKNINDGTNYLKFDTLYGFETLVDGEFYLGFCTNNINIGFGAIIGKGIKSGSVQKCGIFNPHETLDDDILNISAKTIGKKIIFTNNEDIGELCISLVLINNVMKYISFEHNLLKDNNTPEFINYYNNKIFWHQFKISNEDFSINGVDCLKFMDYKIKIFNDFPERFYNETGNKDSVITPYIIKKVNERYIIYAIGTDRVIPYGTKYQDGVFSFSVKEGIDILYPGEYKIGFVSKGIALPIVTVKDYSKVCYNKFIGYNINQDIGDNNIFHYNIEEFIDIPLKYDNKMFWYEFENFEHIFVSNIHDISKFMDYRFFFCNDFNEQYYHGLENRDAIITPYIIKKINNKYIIYTICNDIVIPYGTKHSVFHTFPLSVHVGHTELNPGDYKIGFLSLGKVFPIMISRMNNDFICYNKLIKYNIDNIIDEHEFHYDIEDFIDIPLKYDTKIFWYQFLNYENNLKIDGIDILKFINHRIIFFNDFDEEYYYGMENRDAIITPYIIKNIGGEYIVYTIGHNIVIPYGTKYDDENVFSFSVNTGHHDLVVGNYKIGFISSGKIQPIIISQYNYSYLRINKDVDVTKFHPGYDIGSDEDFEDSRSYNYNISFNFSSTPYILTDINEKWIDIDYKLEYIKSKYHNEILHEGDIKKFVLKLVIDGLSKAGDMVINMCKNIVKDVLGCKKILGTITFFAVPCIKKKCGRVFGIKVCVPYPSLCKETIDLCHKNDNLILIFNKEKNNQEWINLGDLKPGDIVVTHNETYEKVLDVKKQFKDIILLFDYSTGEHPRLNEDGDYVCYIAPSTEENYNKLKEDTILDESCKINFEKDCELISIILNGPCYTYRLKTPDEKEIIFKDPTPRLDSFPCVSLLLYNLYKNLEGYSLIDNYEKIIDYLEDYLSTFIPINISQIEYKKNDSDELNINLLFMSNRLKIEKYFSDMDVKNEENYLIFYSFYMKILSFEKFITFEELKNINFYEIKKFIN